MENGILLPVKLLSRTEESRHLSKWGQMAVFIVLSGMCRFD